LSEIAELSQCNDNLATKRADLNSSAAETCQDGSISYDNAASCSHYNATHNARSGISDTDDYDYSEFYFSGDNCNVNEYETGSEYDPSTTSGESDLETSDTEADINNTAKEPKAHKLAWNAGNPSFLASIFFFYNIPFSII
jgi:hypothetical protein